jgi:hypothetical protein
LTSSYGLSFGFILDLSVDWLGIPGVFYRPIQCFKVCIFNYLSSTSLQKVCNKLSADMRIDVAAITFSEKFSREICCVRVYKATTVVLVDAI